MKKNEIYDLLFNPFKRIAGFQAFGLGLVFILLTGVIGSYSKVRFDGALDMHLGQTTILQSFTMLVVDVCCLVLVMGVAGLILSKGFRFIDLLGTITLSKAPLIIFAICGYFTTPPDMEELLHNPMILLQSTSLIVATLISIPVCIWNIVLTYNALKTSIGVKGTKLTVAFIIALIVSEIISKITLFYLI